MVLLQVAAARGLNNLKTEYGSSEDGNRSLRSPRYDANASNPLAAATCKGIVVFPGRLHRGSRVHKIDRVVATVTRL